jgi:DNA-binding MarR family transcriptional regulator
VPASSATPPAYPDGRCVAGALRRASRAITRHYDEHLAASGLTIARYSLLSTLATLGEPTLSAFGRDLAMERTTLLRNLKPLVDEGLVAIAPARAGRANVARLTARGTKALERARPYWRAAQQSLSERVDRADVEHVLAVAAALSS